MATPLLVWIQAASVTHAYAHRMPTNPVHAKLQVSIPLYEAAARAELPIDVDVKHLLAIMAPAFAKIEAAAQDLIAETDAAKRRHKEAEAAWERERRTLEKMRVCAERDSVATAVAAARQKGPLENPIGYYVYFLWAYGGELMYVGESRNILGRLGDHMRNPERQYAICRITTIECADEAAMHRLEGAAIREHQPPWNILGIRAATESVA